MGLSFEKIEAMAGEPTHGRGAAYYRDGRVRILTADHREAIAEVRGSGNNIYRTQLQDFDGELIAHCSCPVGLNCKHGVATAYAWLALGPESGGPPPIADLEGWLSALDASSGSPARALKPGNHHLLYELITGADGALTARGAKLRILKSYLKQNGEWGKSGLYKAAAYEYLYLPPAFIRPADVEVLRLLPHRRSSGEFELEGDSGSLALQRALATGRLYLPGQPEPLRAGPSRQLDWRWGQDDRGWHLQPALRGLEDWQFLDVDPPLYLDAEAQQLGRLTETMPLPQLRLLLTMPPVPAEALGPVSLRLRRQFTPEVLPLPEEPDVIALSAPAPRLTLVAADTGHGYRIPGAQLTFGYGPVEVEPEDRSTGQQDQEVFCHIDGQDYQVSRDFAREQAYALELVELGLALYGDVDGWSRLWLLEADNNSAMLKRWRVLEQQAFPALEDQGWEITVDEDYSIPLATVQLAMRIEDGAQDWFAFELTLTLGDHPIPTEALMVYWLESDAPEELLVPTEEGWLQLDARPLRALRDLIEALVKERSLSGTVRLPAFRAAQLAAVPELDDRAAPRTRQLAARLRDFRDLEAVPAPATLRASLRSYQQQGLNWLHFLYDYGLGGILADDMGLGKTLQTLALVQHLKEAGQLSRPALVLAPTSVAGNWHREAAQFAPGLRVLLLHGPERKGLFSSIPDHDLIISTYPLLLRDREHYTQQAYSLAVLDEAQAIKNPATKLARCVKELQADCRLCLSGTPLENHLGELWSLMDFALPGLLGTREHFQRYFRTPIEREGDRERQQQLAARVAPFLLRRSKSEVVTELPPKTETIEYVELAGRQRVLYESIRVSMQKRIRDLVAKQGMARSHIAFLDALLKLRQACIDPRLVKLDKARGIHESAKLEWLREALPQLLEEGRKLLVFSQFTEVLGLVEAELKTLGIGSSKLTGRTRKRQAAIDRFQQGEVSVFLISLKAGGSGLNLTAADVVIHLDPWWNPAVEAQASDRAHRIGQNKPVLVYKLIAAGTVEERIQQLQTEKQALAATLFADTDVADLPRDGEALLALLE